MRSTRIVIRRHVSSLAGRKVAAMLVKGGGDPGAFRHVLPARLQALHMELVVTGLSSWSSL